MFKKMARGLCVAAAAALIISVGVPGTMVQAATSTPANVSETAPGYGTVSLEASVDVRTGASTTYPVVATLCKGTSVMIVGQSGNYYKVMYNTSGEYGYVPKTYVTFEDSEYYLQVVYVDADSTLNMRNSDSTSGTIIASIPSSAYLAYAFDSTGGSWYCGVYGNVMGFVSASYTVLCSY